MNVNATLTSSSGTLSSVPTLMTKPSIKDRISLWWASRKLNASPSSSDEGLLRISGHSFRATKRELVEFIKEIPVTADGNRTLTAAQFQRCAELILRHKERFYDEIAALPSPSEATHLPQPTILLDIARFKSDTVAERTLKGRINDFFKDAHRSKNVSVKIGDDSAIDLKNNSERIIKTIVNKYADFLLTHETELFEHAFALKNHPLDPSEAVEFVLRNKKLRQATAGGVVEDRSNIMDYIEEREANIPACIRDTVIKLITVKTLEILSHIYQGTVSDITSSMLSGLIPNGYITGNHTLFYEFQIPNDFNSIAIVLSETAEQTPTQSPYCPFDFSKKLILTDLSKQGDNYSEENGFGAPYEVRFGPIIELEQALSLITHLDQGLTPMEPTQSAASSSSDEESSLLPQSKILAADLPRFFPQNA